MAIIAETTSDIPEFRITESHTISLRWRNGVLEHAVKVIVVENGVPIRQELSWSPVPTADDDGNINYDF